jgi:hypothetical protein
MSGCRLRNMLAWLEDTGAAASVDDPLSELTSRSQPIWYRRRQSSVS